MKKLLLFMLTLCTVLSVCVGCGNKNTDKLNTSNESMVSQEHDTSENISDNDEPSSMVGDSSSEETASDSVSSEDKTFNFTKEEATAYFKSEYQYQWFADITPANETAIIPFSELEKWLDGTSNLKTLQYYGGEEVSIYEMFATKQFHKLFAEIDFYTMMLNGYSMNMMYNGVECSKPVGYDWTGVGGGVFYEITYHLDDVEVNLYVTRLSEYNKAYQAISGTISDYYKAIDREFTAENTQTVKVYDKTSDEYIDVEVYVDEMDGNGIKYIEFIFNKYIFRIEIFDTDNAINFDDILDNIVIMDLLEEYNKIK